MLFPTPLLVSQITSFKDNDLTTKWLHRLSQTATTGESRDHYSQIQALVDYYNRPAPQTESQVSEVTQCEGNRLG